MAVMLIARFDGDVGQLRQAYDRAHALIMSRRGGTGAGELRHHCAIGDQALYIIGVWESEERAHTRWASEEFEEVLTSAGFPSPKTSYRRDRTGPEHRPRRQPPHGQFWTLAKPRGSPRLARLTLQPSMRKPFAGGVLTAGRLTSARSLPTKRIIHGPVREIRRA
jgi:hypothetical protein